MTWMNDLDVLCDNIDVEMTEPCDNGMSLLVTMCLNMSLVDQSMTTC